MTIRFLLTVAMAAAAMPCTVLPAAANDTALLVAQAADQAAEKEAFEAAKELGTVEAWDAFLSNFPTGFRADLARAYVKKLGEAAPAPTAAPLPVTPAAAPAAPLMRPSIGNLELAPSRREAAKLATAARTNCSERAYMKSAASNSQARITFINYGARPFDVFWIDENGQQQLYGEIKKDRQATVDTFTGHPWMLAELNGACLTIAIPNPGPQVFVMGADAPVETPAAANNSSSDCGKGRVRIDGRCVRKSQAADFCGPGYRPEGGRCVQGYQPPPKKQKANTGGGGGGHPWETPRCRAIMAQCNNGANPSACQQHELSCTYQD